MGGKLSDEVIVLDHPSQGRRNHCLCLYDPQVEFEWLRQFWFQGNRYKKCTDWWLGPMAQLEELWRKMEFVVSA